jgi:hypothetical protein
MRYIWWLFICSGVSAWGPTGHIITGLIASRHLSAETNKRIENITGSPLKDIVNWADIVKELPEYQWSRPLHFVDLHHKTYFDYRTDCVNHVCIIGAIYNYTGQLITERNMNISIRFLSHFIGDLHQPFHTGYDSDKGGNLVSVRWNDTNTPLGGGDTNLHAIWDINLIEKSLRDNFRCNITDYVNYLYEKYDVDTFDPYDVIDENIKILPKVYVGNNSVINEVYYDKNIDIVNARLAYAGKRMGIWFDKYFRSQW